MNDHTIAPIDDLHNEETLASIMVLAACCDGEFTVEEVQHISSILNCYPYFPNLTENHLRDIAQQCLESGLSEIELIKEMVENLSVDYHLPALAFAYEICAADLVIMPQEKKFLIELREILNISLEITNALEISIQSRYFASDTADAVLDFPITGSNSLH
ncbi:MAG: tellurite resistance TerB family protein [Gammaproteobacteria bacterium]